MLCRMSSDRRITPITRQGRTPLRELRFLLSALLCAAAVLAGTLVAAPSTAVADEVPAETAPPLRFVSYNICGNMCGDPAKFDNARRVSTVVGEAAGGGWNADQIFLQEVCGHQYDAIDAALSPRGFTGFFTPVKTGQTNICAIPGKPGEPQRYSQYGMAVLVKGLVVEKKVLKLRQGAESEDIDVPCVKNYTQYRLNWACSVHLYWNDSALNAKEAVVLAAQAKAWEDAGVPVVLGGDFNGQPWTTATSPFYEAANGQGATGSFLEADETDKDFFQPRPCTAENRVRCRSGEGTFQDGRKLDYVFVSARSFKDVRGDSLDLDPKVSDHRLLRATAAWRDCGPLSGADGGANAGADGGVLRRDASGALFRYAGKGTGPVPGALAAPCKVGTGWNIVRLVARQQQTLVAVDAEGALWHYPADPETGGYSGSSRVRVGSAWQSMNALLAPGDFSGDGHADLIGRDTSGTLWLYPGDGAGGYGARAKIGNGWGAYNTLLAPGDFTGDGRADLIGRDADGALWLYRGDGAGSYAAREKVGHGWGIYPALFAPGDVTGDGRPDLTGRDADGKLWLYGGDGAGSYGARVQVGNGYPAGELLF